MSDATSFLAAMQLADSALPIGRFVHSYGLESWLAQNPEPDEQTIADLATTHVRDIVAPLDGVVVAHAYRHKHLSELLTLDRATTAYKLSAPAREASCSCGRRLATLATSLSTSPLLATFAAQVKTHETDGNLAVVTGLLAQAMELTVTQSVLVELRGALVGFLSAAVRLGRLAPTKAQILQLELAPTLDTAAAQAVSMTLDELRSTGPELEIAGLAHHHMDSRSFAT